MPNVTINKVTNATVYIDGGAHIGQASEISLPDLEQKMVTHNGLGLAGEFEVPVGFSPMEMSITWNAHYKDALKKLAVLGGSVKLQIRANIDEYTASGGRTSQTAMVIHLTAQPKNTAFGSFKQHENVELESKMNVTAIKMVIGGETIVDYDSIANIYIVDGVDQLATFRANLGQ